jgi:hypothetical protein
LAQDVLIKCSKGNTKMNKSTSTHRKLVLNRETLATLKEGSTPIFAATMTVSVVLCPAQDKAR